MQGNNVQQRVAWQKAHLRLRCKAAELWELGKMQIMDGDVNAGLASWALAWRVLTHADEVAKWKLRWLAEQLEFRLKR